MQRQHPSWRVLVVEDDVDTGDMVVDFLGLKGFTVAHARTGQAALDRLDRGDRPDVILLDMLMPLMDGPTFAAAYRARPGPHAPIIVMTASTSLAEAIAAVEPVGVLQKPFEIADLLAVLH